MTQFSDYKGPSGGLKQSTEWLSSENLPADQDTPVTIEKVLQVKGAKFAGGRTVDAGGALQFKGKERRLLLCTTNRKTLVRLFGADSSAWWGQPITLYIDHKVKLAGKTVDGIRIRDKKADKARSDANRMAEPPPVATPQSPTRTADAIADGGTPERARAREPVQEPPPAGIPQDPAHLSEPPDGFALQGDHKR